MQKNLLRKGLVLGIIVLFVGSGMTTISVTDTQGEYGNDTESEWNQENQSITIYPPQKNEPWNTNDSSNGFNGKNGHLPILEDAILYEDFEGVWPELFG